MKLLKAENKQLKAEVKQLTLQVRKLREIVSTDKNLKQMKAEYNECLTDCKQILEHLENKVQQTMLSEIVGSDSMQLTDLLDHSSLTQFNNMGYYNLGQNLSKAHEHLNLNKLNSMTMSQFEQNFVQEISEAITQPELLTVRDI